MKSLREKRCRYIKKKVERSIAIISNTCQSHVPKTVENKIDETNRYSHSNNKIDYNFDTEKNDYNFDTENIGSSYVDIDDLTFDEQPLIVLVA